MSELLATLGEKREEDTRVPVTVLIGYLGSRAAPKHSCAVFLRALFRESRTKDISREKTKNERRRGQDDVAQPDLDRTTRREEVRRNCERVW